MANGELTAKQLKFIDEYMLDLNATQAAIRAGYSEKTARSIGEENLRKPDIEKEIQRRQKNDSEQSGIARMQIIHLLGMMLNLDPLDLMESKTVAQVSKTGEEFDITFLSVKDLQTIPKEVRVLISEIKQAKDGIDVRWYDKLKVIEILNKMLGFYEAHNEQKHGLSRPMANYTDSELRAIIEKKRLAQTNE